MKPKFKINLHNHTTYSDGMLILSALCGVAFWDYNFDWIGISDHFESDKVGSCVDMINFPSYRKEIISLRDKFPEKKVLIGLEVDWHSGILRKEELLHLMLNREVDYVLFEGLKDKNDLVDLLAFYSLTPRIPLGIAHWNIQKDFSLGDFQQLVPLLLEKNVFIEITGGSKSIISVQDGEVYYYEKNLLYYKFFVENGGMISLGSDIHYRIDDLSFSSKLDVFLAQNDLIKGVNRFIDYLEAIDGGKE